MNVEKGIALGAINVVMIAVGLGVMERSATLAEFLTLVGMIPGVIVGAILGALAGSLASRPVVWRVPVLALPAVGLVILPAPLMGEQ